MWSFEESVSRVTVRVIKRKKFMFIVFQVLFFRAKAEVYWANEYLFKMWQRFLRQMNVSSGYGCPKCLSLVYLSIIKPNQLQQANTLTKLMFLCVSECN